MYASSKRKTIARGTGFALTLLFVLSLVTAAGAGGAGTVDEVRDAVNDTVCSVEETAMFACGGVPLWEPRYDGPDNGLDSARDVGVSPDGSTVFVTGRSSGTGMPADYATMAYDVLTGFELWVARYDPNPFDMANALAVSPDGSTVFVTGESGDFFFSAEFATIAYDAGTGEEKWVARYDGPVGGFDAASGLQLSPDGSVLYVTGSSMGDGTGRDFASVAYDAQTGEELWIARYTGPAGSHDFLHASGLSPDGSVLYVSGSSTGVGTDFDQAAVAYDTTDGSELWVARYDGPASRLDVASSLGVDPGGSAVYVTGRSSGVGTDADYATVAYDAADGSELWVARYDGPASGFDVAHALGVDPDGALVYVTGRSSGVGTNADYATVAYDAADGSELWVARYDGSAGGGEVARALGVDPDGAAVYVTGQSAGDGTGNDYATVAYDTQTGAELWAARYDGSANEWDSARALEVSPDGSRVFVTGESTGAETHRDYATIAYSTVPLPSVPLPV